jgi:hypothetical protein
MYKNIIKSLMIVPFTLAMLSPLAQAASKKKRGPAASQHKSKVGDHHGKKKSKKVAAQKHKHK